MTANTNPPEAVAGRGRRQLVLVFLAFLAPVVIAYALYYGGWRSETTRNYGDLVQPARPIGEAMMQTLDGKPKALSAFRGKWLLVYFGPADCTAQCLESLYKMRQVTAAQGKEAPRIEQLFLLTRSEGSDTLPKKLREFPQLHVLRAERERIEALAQVFALPQGSPLAGLHRVYVVDPLGNLMMSYAPDADPNRMRKDLARLLRVSQVG